MLTNAQMKENRFGRWAAARLLVSQIKTHLANGRIVQVSTHLRVTRYDARHADFFVAKKDGVYVKRGKSLDFIGWCDIRVF